MYKVQYSKEDLTFTNVHLNISSMRPLPKVSKQLFSKINVTQNILFLCHCFRDCESPSVCSLACMGHLAHIPWINTKRRKVHTDMVVVVGTTCEIQCRASLILDWSFWSTQELPKRHVYFTKTVNTLPWVHLGMYLSKNKDLSIQWRVKLSLR